MLKELYSIFLFHLFPVAKEGKNNVNYKNGSIIKFVGFRVSDILPSAFIHYL